MVFKKLTRSCVGLSWAWIVSGFPLVFAKARKCPPGVYHFRLAICDSEIPDFRLEFGHDCDPSESSTLKKLTPPMPVSGFRKPKILNQTIAFCNGFQKTDAKLCGAIVGLDRLGFSIGFCKSPKIPARYLPFQTCDLRFGISGFPIWYLVWVATLPHIGTVRKMAFERARSGSSKNQRY